MRASSALAPHAAPEEGGASHVVSVDLVLGGAPGAKQNQDAPASAPTPSSLDALHQSRPHAVAKYADFSAESAHGAYITGTDGERYLDCASGIGATSTGHSHPKVAGAIAAQAHTFLFAQQNCVPFNPARAAAAESLRRILPEHLQTVFLVNSGSEAVDNALKIARHATGRPNVIVFDGAFHGRTIAAMSMSVSKAVFAQGMHPKMPGLVVAPFPNCGHHTGGEALGSEFEAICSERAMHAVQQILRTQSAPSDTAAMVVEPIQGEGGIVIPPDDFLPRLQRLCNEHGILLILDEVQSGAGRTGKWWAHEHIEGVRPDMVLFAKGIGSGFPVAGLAADPALLARMQPGMLGGTYGGGSMASAAVHATIDVIESEGLLQNAVERGEQLRDGLEAMRQRHAWPVRDVRGRGLMCALDFEGPASVASKVCAAALKEKLLLITSGSGATVRFLPPLIISAEQIDEALQKLEASLCAVFDAPPDERGADKSA